MPAPAEVTPDAVPTWVDRLPPAVQPWARLGRFDRPIGTWLLFWPCAIGLALTNDLGNLLLLPWFLLGSLAMRAAGCAYNDIVDRDLDRQVARTAARPVASGAVSVPGAWGFAVAMSLIGLLVLLQLPRLAQLVALLSLALVAAYPFMKRITWWPQAWLGLTFNWGVWVGWACGVAPAGLSAAALAYAGCVFWTLGYDSIYAVQDREDDALAGIRSSARRLGAHVRPAVAVFYLLATLCFAAALLLARPDPLILLALVPAAIHLAGQLARFAPDKPEAVLQVFRSNATTGLLLFLAFLVTMKLDWPGSPL
jgi:4-hydroxybenzoate polyprenyltransferase